MSRLIFVAMGIVIGVSVHLSYTQMTKPVPVAKEVLPSPSPSPPPPPPPSSKKTADKARALMRVPVEKIDPAPVQLQRLEELAPVPPIQLVLAKDVDEDYRKHNNFQKTHISVEAPSSMRLRESIYFPPSDALGGKNNGYIMVAVLSCCNQFEVTKALLESLTAMTDPIHAVVIDDASSDGSPEKIAKMGYPVLSVGHNSGATAGMNRAWQYFSGHPELQSLWILNNDILVADKTFLKLHRCIMSLDEPAVMGPMSNALGIGDANWGQNCENRKNRHLYGGNKIPQELIDGLPDSRQEYNDWLEEKSDWLGEHNKTQHVHDVFGFFMGFRKDHPLADTTDNILLRGGRNLHQEYWLFNTWRLPARVCIDVFAYHDKGTTLKETKPGVRDVSKSDRGFTRR